MVDKCLPKCSVPQKTSSQLPTIRLITQKEPMASIAYYFLRSFFLLLFDAQMLEKKNCFYTKLFWNKFTFALTHFPFSQWTIFSKYGNKKKKLNTKHHGTCYDLGYNAVMKIVTCERIRFRSYTLECYIRVFSVNWHFFALRWNSKKQPRKLLKFCSSSSAFYRKKRT